MTEKTNDTVNKLPLWQAVLITALTALTSAFAVFIGSGIFMCIAGVLFAFMLCRAAAVAWIAAPIGYLLSFLIMKSPVTALAALLFVVIGAPLAVCVKRRLSLSVTTAVLSVAAAAVLAAMLCTTINQIYGGSISEGFKSYIGDIKAAFGEIFSAFKTVTDENGFVIFTDQVISQLKESFLMTLPAVLAICCEVLAYITAKLFLLVCSVFKEDSLVSRPWRVRTSTVTSAVFVVSYLVCLLAPDANVVYYSAANLMMILMPLTSISGFHFMFGEGSSFRTSSGSGTKILLVSTCVIFFLISPVLLLATFSFWGAFEGFRTYLRNKKPRDDDEE